MIDLMKNEVSLVSGGEKICYQKVSSSGEIGGLSEALFGETKCYADMVCSEQVGGVKNCLSESAGVRLICHELQCKNLEEINQWGTRQDLAIASTILVGVSMVAFVFVR